VPGLAWANRGLGMMLHRQGRIAESCAAFERALVHAEACGDQFARRRVIGVLAAALCDGPTPVADAIDRCEELLTLPNVTRRLLKSVRRGLGGLLAMAGRFEEARAHAGYIDERLPWWLHPVEARELLGDRAGAEEELTAKWQWYRDLGDYAPDARAMQLAYELALLYCDEGRWGDAERCLDYGSGVPVPTYFKLEAVRGLAARARLAAHHGRPAEAVRLAQCAVQLAELGDMLNLTPPVWAARAEGLRANRGDAEARAP